MGLLLPVIAGKVKKIDSVSQTLNLSDRQKLLLCLYSITFSLYYRSLWF